MVIIIGVCGAAEEWLRATYLIFCFIRRRVLECVPVVPQSPDDYRKIIQTLHAPSIDALLRPNEVHKIICAEKFDVGVFSEKGQYFFTECKCRKRIPQPVSGSCRKVPRALVVAQPIHALRIGAARFAHTPFVTHASSWVRQTRG